VLKSLIIKITGIITFTSFALAIVVFILAYVHSSGSTISTFAISSVEQSWKLHSGDCVKVVVQLPAIWWQHSSKSCCRVLQPPACSTGVSAQHDTMQVKLGMPTWFYCYKNIHIISTSSITNLSFKLAMKASCVSSSSRTKSPLPNSWVSIKAAMFCLLICSYSIFKTF